MRQPEPTRPQLLTHRGTITSPVTTLPTSPYQLSEIKEYLGLDPGFTDDDAYLTRLNNAIWQQMINYCGRHFQYGTYTDHIHLSDYEWELDLGVYPVASIAKILFDGNELSTDSYSLTPQIGRIHLDSPRGGQWQIEYTGGYQALPSDLDYAFLECVRLAYVGKDADTSIGPIRQERIDGSVTVAYGLPEGFNQGTACPRLLRPHQHTFDIHKAVRGIVGIG